MPKSGSAKDRFEKLALANVGKQHPAYIHDIEAGSLCVSFIPKAETTVAFVDCSAFLALPHCGPAFASALARWAGGRRRGTVNANINNLKNGFIRFAKELQLTDELRLKDLDTALINRFISFLSQKRSDGSYAVAPYTRVHRVGALKTILEGLKYLGEALPSDCEVQPNPWPSATRTEHGFSEERLPTDEALQFFKYCRDRVEARMAEVESIWAEEKSRLVSPSPHGQENNLILRVKARFGCALPERKALKAARDPLFDDIDAYGYKRVARSFGPYAGDLCPFAYYMLFVTGFNLQPLVDVKASDIDRIENLGRKLISVGSLKHRAVTSQHLYGKPVRASFIVGNDPMSPSSVLQFLLRWTSYLRENSTSPRVGALFLFIPRNRADASKLDSYAQEGRQTTQFNRHTTAFCKRGGFAWTGSRSIRKAVAEIADEVLHGDVIATGQILQHSEVETTREHYHNSAVRARQENYLALGMQLRQRWVDAGGKIEPRNVSAEHDQLAATSGFHCSDPYDSPIPGQEKGRLCTAYGACASCPLARLDIESPYAAARCFQWKVAMAEARATCGAEAFRARWEKSYRALVDVWLPAFPAEVWERAAKLDLPALEELE
jgi:hypothetical protein